MNMEQQRQEFFYTANRQAFLSHASGWALLVVLEGSVFSTLIVIFAPGILLKLALVSLFVAGILYFILKVLCGPLWTRHRLDPERLDLRYGGTTLRILRSNIAAVEPVAGKIRQPFSPGPHYDPRAKSIVVTFSADGVVALKLIEPQAFDVDGATEPVDRIVFNVDRRNELLDALALSPSVARIDVLRVPATPTSPPAQETAAAERDERPRIDLFSTGTLAIAVQGLEHRFGEHVAVDDLDLAIGHGEIYGFLGANGAGKTTTLKMLVGLLLPSRGQVTIAGHDMLGDAMAAKRTLGYLPDRAILYDRLSGREFLQFLAQMRGIPSEETERRIDRLLVSFDLDHRQHSASSTYSFGMKRKLALAGALIHEPSVLILDEPLNGLDPQSARHLKDLFAQLASNGVGILMSTHDLATAETVCDRIGIIHRGRLLAEGSVDELTAESSDAPERKLESAFLRLTGEVSDASRQRI